MKKRKATGSILVACIAMLSISQTIYAKPVSESEPYGQQEAAETSQEVLRNTTFTTMEQMNKMLGETGGSNWSVLYLTEVEQDYWNFSAPGEQEKRELSMNLVSNAYQNLEMFLDNGYLLDYQELSAYAEDYLVRKGEKDAYYTILTECLKNPYLLNKPEPVVTDYTYNGRDYSKVFDPDYYYDSNPDLQLSIGFHPPRLLRHFVEKGITEGRAGTAGFDADAYIAYTDGLIAQELMGLQTSGGNPVVAKYSYSRANYYGKLLGHYDYSALFGLESGENMSNSKENVIDW